ncbi:MAG: WecB/TagA/CpsF family glycosyltransferase [Aequorivita sp.]|nr:WecB/TagA/CpsF family glycosyltransferase [Aequorivita sp.]
MSANRKILGMRVDSTNYNDATKKVIEWSNDNQGRYICISTVHMIMEGYDNPKYQIIVNNADLVTPDGMPLVWMLKALGVKDQQRVYGPDLTLHVCAAAEKQCIPVGFYGGMPASLSDLTINLQAKYPKLKIVYSHSPPFRPLTPEEDNAVVQAINASGARILFVGLGCPKQERWAAEHKGKVNAVMLAVGAAFDFHSGRVKQAPNWIQKAGMEWFFRLLMEPKRLWKRHLKHNPRFIALALLQLLKYKLNFKGVQTP